MPSSCLSSLVSHGFDDSDEAGDDGDDDDDDNWALECHTLILFS